MKSSPRAAQLVVVKKVDGSLHLCADFLTGLNNGLLDYSYPLFCRLDSVLLKINTVWPPLT